MPDTPSITINKQFTYRGKNEVFSNKYHFSGTTPGSATEWKALADAVIAAEQPMLPNTVKFVGALGYVAGDENSVFQVDYTVPPNTLLSGTFSAGAQNYQQMPGDTAFWVRWKTPNRSSRGKWIYGRKYFHAVMRFSDLDQVGQLQRDAAATYGAKMIDGTLPGGFKVCGPQGAVYSSPLVSTNITTRTLKRRGKRP